MPSQVRLPGTVRAAIVAHARRDQPHECCGLLLGKGRTVEFAVAMRNVSASATRYRIDDAAHIDLRRVLRGVRPRLEIIGVYHSHPTGPAMPSPVDVDEAMYPEWIYLIVGLDRQRAQVGAFHIRKGKVRSLRIR